jgi:carotenoid cleavage dioxygenase-like enzyme
VYPYGGTLLAFGEQGLPWELDPATLETRGVFTFGGRLNDVSPFSAHPKFDPATGEMFNFGVSFSATQPKLHVYRFDTGAQLLHRQRLPLDYACSVHDCSLSPSSMVFYLSPYILHMEAMMRNGQTLMDALCWEPERGSRLLIVSRATGAALASIPIGQGYCLHLINCFETDNQLTVDVVEYDRPIYSQYQVLPDLFTGVGEARPVRFVVDRHSHALLARHELAAHLAPDFPAIDPRHTALPYRDVWMLSMAAPVQHGRKFFNQLVHVDWAEATASDVYQASALHYLGGEPIFIADPQAERAGVILCQVFDAAHITSTFAIFDAFHIASGPVGWLHLREPIPLLFHASFQRTRER